MDGAFAFYPGQFGGLILLLLLLLPNSGRGDACSSSFRYPPRKRTTSIFPGASDPMPGESDPNPDSSLFARHPRPQIIILRLGKPKHILHLFHMPAPIPPQPLHRHPDQTLLAFQRMIPATLPPHRPAETHVLDILDLLRGGLGRVVGDHCARGRVVAPGGDGVEVVVDLGAGGVGEGLVGVG